MYANHALAKEPLYARRAEHMGKETEWESQLCRCLASRGAGSNSCLCLHFYICKTKLVVVRCAPLLAVWAVVSTHKVLPSAKYYY